MAEPEWIHVRGAREHNLKNIDVSLPRNSLVVITGVSGSGKSSLAFQTLHQEGQRRFAESLSAYARQFLGKMDRPDVDSIEGLSPTICIDQKTVNRNPRSTVGTMTEIYDHLRLLFARLGTPHCPLCQHAIVRVPLDRILESCIADHAGQRVHILGTVVRERKGEYVQELDDLRQQGWTKVRIDGELRSLDEPISLARYEKHTLELVIDRLSLEANAHSRFREAVEKAIAMSGDGSFLLLIDDREYPFSIQRACPNHPEVSIPELEPRIFSFNAPQGWCPDCQGLGAHSAFAVDKIINFDAALPEACLFWSDQGKIPFTRFDREASRKIAQQLGAKTDKPLREWPAKQLEAFLYGEPDHLWTSSVVLASGQVDTRERSWNGIFGILDEVWHWTKLPSLAEYRRETICSSCMGQRLNPVARAVRWAGRTLVELGTTPISELKNLFLHPQLSESEKIIANVLLQELSHRLRFLDQVGLGYLSLDRPAGTLSGGEAQRIRLAAQVGSALQGITYVLDEPSIGLHPRDNERLLKALQELRDRGNTVIVVEHDQETIEAADWVIDIGPAAGASGGHVLVSGPPRELLGADSLTASYLRGDLRIQEERAPRTLKDELTLRQVRTRNLKGFDLAFQMGTLNVVTGVSGSGKSTLIFEVLEPSLKSMTAGEKHYVGCASLESSTPIAQVILIDQDPIGRTPRSNPATYVGAMDKIRDLLAATVEAQARGYKKGRFSFNVAGGRCETCQGAGVITVEMQFLPDVEVECESCRGKRFNSDTLDIRYRGKNIADILSMTIVEAAEFFKAVPSLYRILHTLVSVGLGYPTLGQSATTLSGGEAQRLKLATELHKSPKGHVVYLLDEPTTGLHFEDVRRLLQVIHAIVDKGHTVILVEHHLDVIRAADWITDLGPEGGDEGGELVGMGTPAEIAALPTPTGKMLAKKPQPIEYKEETYFSSVEHSDVLQVFHARQHHLADISVSIPHGKMTVITGPSGSGKTTLALDTIFAEGQRRYVDSLSTYARRFLGRVQRPLVERIEGLQPAIAIDQETSSHSGRSTVATATEIQDSLRVLYARVGEPHCIACGKALLQYSPTKAADQMSTMVGMGWILSRVPTTSRTPETLVQLGKEGFSKIYSIQRSVEKALEDQDALALWRGEGLLVMDRVRFSGTPHARLAEAVAAARKHGTAMVVSRESSKSLDFPEIPTCDEHGAWSLGELTPRHFSFNSRLGACPTCEGMGQTKQIQKELLIDRNRPFWQGLHDSVSSLLRRSKKNEALFEAWASYRSIDLHQPVQSWSQAQWKEFWYGSTQPLNIAWSQAFAGVRRHIKEVSFWPGLLELIKGWTARLESLFHVSTCPECEGARLRKELCSVSIFGLNLPALQQLRVDEVLLTMKGWNFQGSAKKIAEAPLREITRRLHFLEEVGLSYLSLDRAAESLSGGESRRIRLASQLGNGLTGVTYVLDEPTIGLHPADTGRLLKTLRNLTALGNTLVVVEHDLETIQQAEHVIDMGPGAGKYGGRILSEGSPKELQRAVGTGISRWLSGQTRIAVPKTRREPKTWIKLREPRLHELKMDLVSFPEKCWTVVSGVSGSGKSTLILDVLVPSLMEKTSNLTVSTPPSQVIVVDQSPIGKNPRSIPATYLGILDGFRALFASTTTAQAKGWGPGRFSFNMAGGRCELCEGRGATLVEMHFLPDVWVPCESCRGKRFSEETLQIRWQGVNIGDVLAMRADEALERFQAHAKIARSLQALVDVGLDYLELGQPGHTLSGGEAQRIKLAAELSTRQNYCVYILDEPTSGLHLSDVERLISVLHRLVDQGQTLITIEHHPDIMRQADWMIELGPGGGPQGGNLVATGTPEHVALCKTATGFALQLED